PGDRQRGAAARRIARGGKQKARLALVANGERDERRVKQRHALEVEPRMASRADAVTLVDVDVAGFDQPVFLVQRARRVSHVVERDVAEGGRANSSRRAARVRCPQLETRTFEYRPAVLIYAGGLAAHFHVGVGVLDPGCDAEMSRACVIERIPCRDFTLALADDDLAFQAVDAVLERAAQAFGGPLQLLSAVERRLERGCRSRRGRAGRAVCERALACEHAAADDAGADSHKGDRKSTRLNSSHVKISYAF